MRVIVGIWDDDGQLIDEAPFAFEKERAYRTIGEVMVWLDCEMYLL